MALSIFNDKKVFVTAGSTRAYLDAVRFITNRSTGRLGAEIALECLRRRAYVSFFHGEDAITPHQLVRLGGGQLDMEVLSRLDMIAIDTVPQLLSTIKHKFKEDCYAIAIHAMAVLDFVPDETSVFDGKVKSDRVEWTVTLRSTPKIINNIKIISPTTTLVGFKLEVGLDPQELTSSSIRLMDQSGAEIVVANDLRHVNEDSYRAILIERAQRDSKHKTFEVEGRAETATLLCDRLEALLKLKQAG